MTKSKEVAWVVRVSKGFPLGAFCSYEYTEEKFATKKDAEAYAATLDKKKKVQLYKLERVK